MTAGCAATPLVVGDPMYAKLKSLVIETTGLSYYLNQEQELAHRITGRITALDLAGAGAYLDWLSDDEKGEAEWNALVSELTIGETYFFRHQEQFDALRDRVLPDIIHRNQHQRRMRIWSAGCATGAELYSIAVLLRRDLAHLLAGWDITLLGTDVNREFLACGQRGEFNDWALRAMTPAAKEACFSRSRDQWVIAPEYREGVAFQYHNLVRHPFPSLLNNLSSFDLIVCRNVTIYFEREIVSRIIGQFHDCLVDGGWLVVGHAESNIELFRAFRTVNVPGAVMYQRPAVCSESATAFPEAAATGQATNPEVMAVPFRSATVPAVRNPGQRKQNLAGTAPARALASPQPNVLDSLREIRAMADQARWDDALRACQNLIVSAPLNPPAHFYHAIVLEQIGNSNQAEQTLRRAIYLDRQFVLAHYHLGLALQRRGDKAAANRSFRCTVKLLEQMDTGHPLDGADGLTAGELKQWTQTHLDVLNRS